MRMKPITLWRALLLAMLSAAGVGARQSDPVLRGRVTDELGGVIVGATVVARAAGGGEKSVMTDSGGVYVFKGLRPGRYTLKAEAPGFAAQVVPDVGVVAGRPAEHDLVLKVAEVKEELTVGGTNGASLNPEDNANAIVLRGRDLDVLPDDPDEMAAVLQSMAGPSVGLNAGPVYIDGLAGGRLPPKESIREVRINQNPYNAESDRAGFGRIEVYTKPGTEEFHGSGFFNISDEAFNSRNPFVPTRAPYQYRLYGGTLSGPLVARRTAFFLDFQRQEADNNAFVNAKTLDGSLAAIQSPFTVIAPARLTNFNARFDHKLNDSNTLAARLSYGRHRLLNQGVGLLSLPEHGFTQTAEQYSLNLTETAVINNNAINESRLQLARERRARIDNTDAPALVVQDAFVGGGAGFVRSSATETRLELLNYTTLTRGRHVLRFGGRLRGVRLRDFSSENFNGTFVFTGGTAPRLDAGGRVVTNEGGQAELEQITSLERYRRTRLFLGMGLPPAEIRARGGGASQVAITGGDPVETVTQFDFGAFLQDEWRINPNFNLGLGLRYEAQSNIGNGLNLAPRIFFAWAPRGGGTNTFFGGGGGSSVMPKWVIRGGLGVFYDRFSELNALQARRFGGLGHQRFFSTDPAVLDLFPTVPQAGALAASAPPATTRIAPGLRAPYSIMYAVNVEHMLRPNVMLFLFAYNYHTRRAIRMRNVNAPLPGTFMPGVPGSGLRPFGDVGEIFQYESGGRFDQNQMLAGVRLQLDRTSVLFIQYALGQTKSDTDFAAGGGLETSGFPANSYDLTGEYGPSTGYIPHRLVIAGTLNLPWLRLVFNPLVLAASGRPFNITTGRDNNGDKLFTDRPSFATPSTAPLDLVRTTFGDFDINPRPGQPLIPRNFGRGPSFFTVNFRLSRTIGFGETRERPKAAATQAANVPAAAASRRPEAQPTPPRPYQAIFSVQVVNVFNHNNLGLPVGNLGSPFFGRPVGTVGSFIFGNGVGSPSPSSRRVEAQVRLRF